MNRRSAMLASHLTLLAACSSIARADVPDPNPNSVEDAIVGNASGRPLGAGGGFGTQAVPGYEVTIRRPDLTPVPGARVWLVFPAPIQLYGEQSSGTTVDCTAQTLSRFTDPTGLALFQPRFRGFNNWNTVEVWTDFAPSTPIAHSKARSTDFLAPAGTGLEDLSAFRVRFYDYPTYNPEADFGGGPGGSPDGVDGLADLSVFRIDFFGAPVGGGYCP